MEEPPFVIRQSVCVWFEQSFQWAYLYCFCWRLFWY